jgi:fructokinase
MRIGIDLGGSKIEGIVFDADGRTICRRREATPGGDYEGTLAAIAALVAALEAEAARPCSVGVGIPGALSPASGLVKNANATWLIGKPLDRDLAKRLGRPVRIANDANCFAISEARDGAAAGAAVVFGVILGTGVGGGIVVDGRPLTGRHAIAGEWGHNPLPWPTTEEWPGPACYCGRRGCIETFLSGPALAQQYRRVSGRRATAMEVAARLQAGEAAAAMTFDRYAERLARALAHVINILDPEVIVLGGGVSNIAALYEAVPRYWQRWVFSDAVTTRLVRHRHGDASGVRGAAWLWNADT